MIKKYLLSTAILFEVNKSDSSMDILNIFTEYTKEFIGKIHYDQGYAHITFADISFIEKDNTEISNSALKIHLENMPLKNIKKLMLYIVKNCNTVWDLFYYGNLPAQSLLAEAEQAEEKARQEKDKMKQLFEIMEKETFKENICFKESFFTTGKKEPMHYYWRILNDKDVQLGSIEYIKSKNAIQIYLEKVFTVADNPFSTTRDVIFMIRNKNSRAFTNYIIDNVTSVADLFLLKMFTKPFNEKNIRIFYDEWHNRKYFKKSFGIDFYKPVSFVKQNEEGRSYNEQFVDVFQDNEKIAVLSYSGKSVSLNFTDNALSPIKFKSANAMNLMNWWAVSADRLQDFMYAGDKDNDGIPYQKEFEFYKKVNNANVSKRQA